MPTKTNVFDKSAAPFKAEVKRLAADLPPEPPPVAIVATIGEDEALAQRLTDYVHHRLNQYLPAAVAFYVAELREVIAGKRA